MLPGLNCQHLIDGTCAVATAIHGQPVRAFESNCNGCQAKATVENPTQEVLGLVRYAAMQSRLAQQPDAPQSPEAAAIELRTYVGFFPCTKRGPQTRVAPCQSCSLKGKMVAVHQCSHFKRECTSSGSGIRDANDGDFVQACWTCEVRNAPAFDMNACRVARCGYLEHPGWAGRYQGGHLFLICGGPSLAGVDWSILPKRGPMTLAVNNAGAAIPIRPDLWISSDPAGRFAPEIWRDPGITKFVSRSKRNEVIQDWDGEKWSEVAEFVGAMPNVQFYGRGSEAFDAGTFFTADRMQYGRAVLSSDGRPTTRDRSTMLFALRLAVDLGFTTINIVGADFAISADAPQYAWTENGKESRATTSSATFRFLNLAFKSLRPQLDSMGVKVWNCTPGGGLTAFNRRPFEDACRESEVKKSPTLQGLYDYSRNRSNATPN